MVIVLLMDQEFDKIVDQLDVAIVNIMAAWSCMGARKGRQTECIFIRPKVAYILRWLNSDKLGVYTIQTGYYASSIHILECLERTSLWLIVLLLRNGISEIYSARELVLIKAPCWRQDAL